MPEHCIYCMRPVFTAGLITPMCEEHFELSLIRAFLVRNHLSFTPGRVLLEKKAKEASGTFQFRFYACDVVPLMAEMTTDDYIPATHTAAMVEA
jgi:hypothetical protein